MRSITTYEDGTQVVLQHGTSEVQVVGDWYPKESKPQRDPSVPPVIPDGEPRDEYQPQPGEWFEFDIETNGLLDTLTKLHIIALKDVVTGVVYDFADAKYGPGSCEAGVRMLMTAKRVIGHNIIKFDIPALQKLFPWFSLDGVEVEDTLVESRLIWSDLTDRDMRLAKAGRFPGRLIGSHSLEAWGYRLGLMKGDYSEMKEAEAREMGITGRAEISAYVWASWNPEMHTYGVQDVEVTDALWKLIRGKRYSPQALMIEHRFATIIAMQERRGFAFDVAAAQKLYSQLVGVRMQVADQLKSAFPPKEVTETFIPKVNNKARGYVKGEPFTKRWFVDFNPSSRQMIADRLKEKGWNPIEFTPSGQAKIDEGILSQLPYPEAAVLARHFLVEKRIGQLAEGDQALLRLERKGRIHGSVNTNGAVTGRCTHSNPNVAQVPKVKSGKVDGVKQILLGETGGWGYEFRSLFGASKGWALVGIDLAGVELRCLAHYMARYDDGAYGRAVVEGQEADGTDVHSLNAKALGLDPKGSYVVFGKTSTGRDLAKTFIYAFLYGAGDEKLGSIAGVSDEEVAKFPLKQGQRWARAVAMLEKQKRKFDPVLVATIVKGGMLKTRFLKQTPALARLREDVSAKAKAGGTLKALDGRILAVRHAHASLNTLLQNAGALVAKLATILAYDNLSTRGYVFGRDWALVAHIHDELQIECKKELADEIGKIVVQSMVEAGVQLGFRVPIDGTAKAGRTWADSH